MKDYTLKCEWNELPAYESILHEGLILNVAVKDIGKYIINRDTFRTPLKTIYTEHGLIYLNQTLHTYNIWIN